jgi:hypothetical protein
MHKNPVCKQSSKISWLFILFSNLSNKTESAKRLKTTNSNSTELNYIANQQQVLV